MSPTVARQPIEGVSLDLNDAMAQVQATVIAEDGMFFRVCEHMIAHPIGHSRDDKFDRHDSITVGRHHKIPSSSGLVSKVECCGCCFPNW